MLFWDLGQSFDSNVTLSHYELSPRKGETVLFVGDLSYADNYPNHDNERWDTWGRFTKRSVAYQPWIWTTGNHEIDFAPEIHFAFGICTPIKDQSAPVYITIGDGGNLEGLATKKEELWPTLDQLLRDEDDTTVSTPYTAANSQGKCE
ncbi:hypothetical protein LR48_Vigan05g036800 [Vigna angularis]|uniref:acid phosphatase n=1 Tax=Phaseolus angularis TaxID=3914 RepID=A0A0L9UJL7_PHAAN|nr:hypothetical protein LR48_Vigan05g036800 [Vigna angularis]